MNPPANPHQAEFNSAYREAMQACGRLSAEQQPEAAPISASDAAYCLTWPGTQAGVVTINGQWYRNIDGDIVAWYSAEQLQAALEAMQDCKTVTV